MSAVATRGQARDSRAGREPAQSYRFGTGSNAGVWLGLSAARVTGLGLGVVATIGLLATHAGFALACLPLIVAAALTFLPVAGRPLAVWVAPMLGQVAGTVSGGSRWTAPLPTTATSTPAGTRTSTCAAVRPQSGRLLVPAPCGRAWWTEIRDELTGAHVGLLHDTKPTNRTTDRTRAPAAPAVTVSFAVTGVDRFGLLDPDGQDRLALSWGRVLAAFAAPERRITHLQLTERVAVGETDLSTIRAWAHDRRPAPSVDDVASTDALCERIAASTVRRDTLLTLRLARPVDEADLLSRLREVAMDLLTADLLARPLSADELHASIGRTLHPGELAQTPGPHSRDAALSCRADWDAVRVDDAFHRGFAITGWPASPVPARWLGGMSLTAPPAGARILAIHLTPVPPPVAHRMARAARARADLDRADRRRFGLADSATDDHAAFESASMQAELVAGHATHRIAAVLCASTRSPAELADATRGLHDAAASAGLTVRALHGQHPHALTAALPLARLRFGGSA